MRYRLRVHGRRGRRPGWPTWSPVLLVVGSVAVAVAHAIRLFLFLGDRARSFSEVPA